MGRLPAGRGMSNAPNAVHSIDKWRLSRLQYPFDGHEGKP
jgi:hypothetical protein